MSNVESSMCTTASMTWGAFIIAGGFPPQRYIWEIGHDSAIISRGSLYPLFRVPISPGRRKETFGVGVHIDREL